MNLPQLSIQSQQAKVGIQHHKPEMIIQQRSADLQINQELVGNLRISTTASQLFIDQTEAFADAGLIGPLRRSKEWAASSKQSLMQYIGKTAHDGERLKRIEHGTNALSMIAKTSGERPQKEVGLGMVPKHASRVRFNYRPSDVNVAVDWPEPMIRFRKNDPDIHIPKWQTNVYLEQKNWIAFFVVNSGMDRQL